MIHKGKVEMHTALVHIQGVICIFCSFFIFRFLPLVSSLRIPKWLYNSPVLTNLPFLPALDLGSLCSAGGVEGVCHTKAKCEGLGLTQAGSCTRGKSVCCTGKTVLRYSGCNLQFVMFQLSLPVTLH